jgi:hypothetical protein
MERTGIEIHQKLHVIVPTKITTPVRIPYNTNDNSRDDLSRSFFSDSSTQFFV